MTYQGRSYSAPLPRLFSSASAAFILAVTASDSRSAGGAIAALSVACAVLRRQKRRPAAMATPSQTSPINHQRQPSNEATSSPAMRNKANDSSSALPMTTTHQLVRMRRTPAIVSCSAGW